MDLQGAKALVTGGSEGVGRAIAAAFEKEGADVVITGRREDALEATAAAIGVGWIAGDVGDQDDAIRTVREFVDEHSRLDILVNNSGPTIGGSSLNCRCSRRIRSEASGAA